MFKFLLIDTTSATSQEPALTASYKLFEAHNFPVKAVPLNVKHSNPTYIH